MRNGKLIPIEVKSADNTKAKSLKIYMEAYKPEYAVKLSAKNFAFEDNKTQIIHAIGHRPLIPHNIVG